MLGETPAGRKLGAQGGRVYSAIMHNSRAGWSKPGLKSIMRIADAMGYETRIKFVRRREA